MTRQFEGTENKFVYDSEAGYARLDKKYRAAALITSQAAEIERLREALEAIIARSHNDPLGTSKVIDMRRIAERALTTGAAHVRVD